MEIFIFRAPDIIKRLKFSTRRCYFWLKKEPAEGWPVINGDYIVGDPKSCVAGATLASH